MNRARRCWLLLICLLMLTPLMTGCQNRRKTVPMSVNGAKVTVWDLEDGRYLSPDCRTLVNTFGLLPDFDWDSLTQKRVSEGGSMRATHTTDTILDCMNYYAWDYHPTEVDVMDLASFLKQYGFTSENRITSQWLESHVDQALQLYNDLQFRGGSFLSYCQRTARCEDTASYVPAFNNGEACLIYPRETLAFSIGNDSFEAIRWANTNGAYENRSVYHTLRCFCLETELNARDVQPGSFTVQTGSDTAVAVNAVNLLAWDERYQQAKGVGLLRTLLESFGFSKDQPLTGEWLCQHFANAVSIYEALPDFYRRWCGGEPLFMTPEVMDARQQ